MTNNQRSGIEEFRAGSSNSDTDPNTAEQSESDPAPKNKNWYRFIGATKESPPNNETPVGDIWTGFKERTTSHGIPHVHRARGGCKIIFWVILSLGSLVVLLYQISIASIYFIGNPIDVVVSLDFRRQLTFPAVTVCNLNPIQASRLNQSTELYDVINAARRRRRDTGEMEAERVPYRQKRSSSSYDIQQHVMEVLSTMTEAEKEALGNTLDETIVDCRFAGSNCFLSEFTSYFDPVYGNCFLWNSGWTGLPLDKSKRAGRRHGLHLIVNIHQEEYIAELSEGAGVRVVVHPQTRMPFPSDEGILANPGELTSIGMKKTTVNRLGNGFTNCDYISGSNADRNVYEEYYNVSYSTSACYRTCYQSFVISECGCADPEIPLSGVAFDNRNVAACSTLDADATSCKTDITRQFQNDELDCDCQIPCDEVAYSFEVSSVEWPSEANQATVLSNLQSLIPNIADSDDPSTTMRSNLLKLDLYFQEFNYERIEEFPAYRKESYVSDIGGILGLWVGCSVISLFEFVELFFDLIVLACYRCCNSKALQKSCCKPASQDMGSSSSMGENPNGYAPNARQRVLGSVFGTRKRVGNSVPDTPPPPYYANVHNMREKLYHKQNSTSTLFKEEAKKRPIKEHPIKFV